ncbi:MAG: ABC transporter ATP-binding protein, partial [Desulfobacteraceae bacterium]|nr:ABC transporter ATP-binding protein [Desulfobacteraceae bacterium]
MTRAIEVKGVCASYGEQSVLDALSFAVDKGECFIVIGPNGSGKTTLMKLATGIHRPDAGEVFIGGNPIRGYGRKALARKMAFV